MSKPNQPVVKIDGKVSGGSTAIVPPNFPNRAAIKVIFRPNYKGGGLTVEVVGFGACANWNTLFNAPSFGFYKFAFFSTVIDGTVCCPRCAASGARVARVRVLHGGGGGLSEAPERSTELRKSCRPCSLTEGSGAEQRSPCIS